MNRAASSLGWAVSSRVRRASIAAALLTAVCAATFAPTLQNQFILDDQYIVVDNAAIRDLSRLPAFFVSTPPGALNREYYRPITLASFAIDHALFGLHPTGFHAVNLLLHAAVSVLVFALLSTLTQRGFESLLGALLFAVHPVQGEVVYLVNYRATSLAALFYVGALLFYLRARQRPWTLAGGSLLGVLYFCSLGAKEIGVTLPAAMLLCDWLAPGARRPSRIPYLSCLLVLGLYLGLRQVLCSPASATYFADTPPAQVLMTMLVVEARALVLLFVPADLAGVYDASCLPHPNRVSDPTLLLSAALLAGVFVLALRLRRRAPLLTLAIGLHFVALAPTYQLIPIPVLFGERFLYLALPGLCLGVAVLLSNLRRPLLARAVQAAVFAVCVWFAGLSHARAYDWHDPVRFWRATLKVRPNSLQAHIGLAEALRRERRCAEALPHYEASMWLAGNDRRHRLIWGAAASCFSIAGDPQRSRAIIEAWLARHPGDAGFRAMRATLAGAGQR